ncbi:uncharacterized protein TNCV_4991151 [Trichonephila clavipes]|nr:uncharacterized protein TNCV_4991151 [Trichonephila clavipes]
MNLEIFNHAQVTEQAPNQFVKFIVKVLIFVIDVSNIMSGCGSPVVKVSDHGRNIMSSSPVRLKTHRVRKPCTLNLSRTETSSRWCSVLVRRGVPAQVSSTSLDHGSKLHGPSPKALV